MHSYILFKLLAPLASEVGGRAWVSEAAPPEVGVKSAAQLWSWATLLGRSQAGGSPGCCRMGFVLSFNLQQLRLLAQPLQIQRPFDCSGTVPHNPWAFSMLHSFI